MCLKTKNDSSQILKNSTIWIQIASWLSTTGNEWICIEGILFFLFLSLQHAPKPISVLFTLWKSVKLKGMHGFFMNNDFLYDIFLSKIVFVNLCFIYDTLFFPNKDQCSGRTGSEKTDVWRKTAERKSEETRTRERKIWARFRNSDTERAAQQRT